MEFRNKTWLEDRHRNEVLAFERENGLAHVVVGVKRSEKLTGPTSLYFMTIADSGERKSTCDSFFTKAIRDYEIEQLEDAKPDLKAHKASLDAWTAERDGILLAIKEAEKKGQSTDTLKKELGAHEFDKPKPPRIPQLLRGDDTPENLAWALAKDWPSAMVASSEAGIIFGSHAMGKDSIMRNLTLLNILWDGGTLSVGRRTSESFTLRGARLTMALQVQESTLRSFFDRSDGLARGTGFLARFLMAWPESTQGHRPFTEAPDGWPALAAFNSRITGLLKRLTELLQNRDDDKTDDDGILKPCMLSMTADAKAAWVEFHDAIEGELASGVELYDVRDVASKIADNAVRLAALFQVFESDDDAIGPEAFESAGRVAAWYLNESRRFFGELALPAELVNAARLDSWLIGYSRRQKTNIVPRRDVQRNVTPTHLRQKAALEDALHELIEVGRVVLVRNGRRKEIHINPALIEGGAV